MNQNQARAVLAEWDKQGRYIFTRGDLRKLFRGDNDKAFAEGVRRLVAANILIRATHGVYVINDARSADGHTLERIAIAKRRGSYNYVSLESALFQWGVLSQAPLGRLTVMTTGRRGAYRTTFGGIEFTHTVRSYRDIIDHTITGAGPLPIASAAMAGADLRRVGRDTPELDWDALADV